MVWFSLIYKPTGMRAFALILCVFFVLPIEKANGQAVKSTHRDKPIAPKSFDSSRNYVGKDVLEYVGQEWYFKEESLKDRDNCCNWFYNVDESGVAIDMAKGIMHEPIIFPAWRQNYSDYVGRKFTVLEVKKAPDVDFWRDEQKQLTKVERELGKANNVLREYVKRGLRGIEDNFFYNGRCYVVLLDKVASEKIYYYYDARSEAAFPFVDLGYLAKEKEQLIGHKFVFSDAFIADAVAPSGSTRNAIITGAEWKCTDFSFDTVLYAFTLELWNRDGQTLIKPVSRDWHGQYIMGAAYSPGEADSLKSIYGAPVFDALLHGSVRPGMTRTMCQLALGKPQKRTIATKNAGGRGKVEVWSYAARDSMYYFSHDTLLRTLPRATIKQKGVK